MTEQEPKKPPKTPKELDSIVDRVFAYKSKPKSNSDTIKRKAKKLIKVPDSIGKSE